MDINLQGDSKETLKALIPLLKKNEDRSWRIHIEKEIERWWRVLDAKALEKADPLNPQLVFREFSKRLPDDCIITADCGSVTTWYARDIRIRKGMRASLSGTLATMCPAIPYAIAAKFAYPQKACIALVGDGAMQMMGNNEMITVAKYWKKWKNPQFIILVLNNRDLNMVSWEQRAFTGDPKFEGSQDIPDFPYAEYARLLGFEGIRVSDPAEINDALDKAFTAQRPALIEAVTDPNVPLLPPHISTKQKTAFFSSLIKGDKDAWGMVKQTYKEVMDEYFVR
jgi:pyruvate dehydrogenase (quinone)